MAPFVTRFGRSPSSSPPHEQVAHNHKEPLALYTWIPTLEPALCVVCLCRMKSSFWVFIIRRAGLLKPLEWD